MIVALTYLTDKGGVISCLVLVIHAIANQSEVSRQSMRSSASQPSKAAVGSKLLGGAKPASVNSGSPHQQADIGGVDNDKSWNRAWGSCATLVGD